MISTQNLEILRKFRNRCVKDRKKTSVVHELVPRSRKTNWTEYGNQVPLCLECHEWAHRVGTRKSAVILSEFRDRRLKEYGLTIQNLDDFISDIDSQISDSYGRVAILNESVWRKVKETLLSQQKTIEDLRDALRMEMDLDNDP